MAKNNWAKIIAWIALVCIIVSIIGTGILFIFSNNWQNIQPIPEELQDYLNDYNETYSGTTNNSNSGNVIDIEQYLENEENLNNLDTIEDSSLNNLPNNEEFEIIDNDENIDNNTEQ